MSRSDSQMKVGLFPLAFILTFLATLPSVAWAQHAPDNRVLLIVLEGLRPEFVTPRRMPNLYKLSRRGVRATAHHSVFPTVAPVNAASITTGAYPSTHGILSDIVFVSGAVELGGYDAESVQALEKFQSDTGESLLTVPSLGEILAEHRKKLLVINTGSSGSALLLHPEGQGGGIVHPKPALPDSRGDATAWAVNTYFELGLETIDPEVTILWLREPGHTQDEEGIGARRRLRAIREADEAIGRIVAGHTRRGLGVDVFVISDRGVSAYARAGVNLKTLLIENGLRLEGENPDAVIVGSGSIYVKDHDRAAIRQIVEWLQRADEDYAIYTQQARPTHPESFVPGAMSFQAVYLDHLRAPDILVDQTWFEDIHATFAAAGPGIKSAIVNVVPTANYDLAPTICYLLGIEPPAAMDGRVLHEILRDGPDPASVSVLRRRHGSQAKWSSGTYRMIMQESSVDGVEYFDFMKVEKTD